MKTLKVSMSVVALAATLSSAQAAQPVIVQTNLGAGHTQLVVTGTGSSQEFIKPFKCAGTGDGTYRLTGSMLKVGLSSGTSVLRVGTGLSDAQQNTPGLVAAGVQCGVNGAGDLSCTASGSGDTLPNPGPGNGNASCRGVIAGVGTVITASCSCEKQ